MGFLGDLFDDVLDIPVKVIKAPGKVISAVDQELCIHDWSGWRETDKGNLKRTCRDCGAKEKR